MALLAVLGLLVVWAVLTGVAAERRSRLLIPLATLPVWGPLAAYLLWMLFTEWLPF